MEQDKHLKEILLNSAEGASPDFTDRVMKKVFSLSVAPNYTPLVSPTLKKWFVFTFGGIVIAILSLCLAIALGDLNVVGWFQNIPFPDINYYKVLLFIFIFWILFTLNMQFQNNFQLNRGGSKHHD